MDGEPLQLVHEDENGNLTYNNEVADQILRNDEVINRLVAVISITGSERTGKSFLLNYILRYLASNDPNNQFGLPGQPLNGYPFRGGTKKQTRGILVWSKPFIRRLTNGKEIAVILMDTQGIHGKSTVNDGPILSFCSFVSSIQIYNTKSHFQTNSLEELDIFIRNARSSSPSENIKVFQKLVILVRDWSLDENFGFESGNVYLSELLNNPENNEIARDIESSFSEQVSCHLMPMPCYRVSSENFKGSLNELEEIFVENLKNFITLLIDESMIAKKIAGHEVTGERLCRYFNDCFDTIRHNQPLIRMTESYIKSICDDIISKIRVQYELTYKAFVVEKISQFYTVALQSVKDFKPKRNELCEEAEKEFLEKSKLTGNLYYQHLGTLKNELKIAFYAIEESNLKNLCERTMRVLEYYYCETMTTFAKRYFLSYLVTSEKKLKKKHKTLMSKLTEEFKNLDENSVNWCSAHMEEKLILSLNKHKKRKIRGWFKVAGTTIILASSGVGIGFGIAAATAAAAGGAAASAAAGAAGRAAAGVAGPAADVAVAAGAAGAVAGAGAVANAAAGAAGKGGPPEGKAVADVIFKIAQGGLLVAKGVGGVAKGKTEINDTDENTDEKKVKKPDPELVFISTLKIVVMLLKAYLSVGGKASNLLVHEEIPTE